MKRCLRAILPVLACAAVAVHAQAPSSTPRAPKRFIGYAEAAPFFESFQQSLPGELRGKTTADTERAWSDWVARHDRVIRARLERGDEDSLVYLWLYGTSFTNHVPLTERNLEATGGEAARSRLVQQRLGDLLTGLASPRGNDRLQFARGVVEKQGMNLSTASGKTRARAYLESLHGRVLRDYTEQKQTLESLERLDAVTALAAYVTLFRDRGLSSDTSLYPSFAVEQALAAMKTEGTLAPGGVARVAVVGPGLDFANKDEGYDFYPQQTIQPFALMDSLTRLGLAGPERITVATFDLSPRVNQHIEAALAKARAGNSYTVHVPLPAGEEWNPDFVAYWRQFGDRVGAEIAPPAARPNAGSVAIRAVRIPPARVLSLRPHDVNIVLERLEPLADDERFDLIVATNILVYYDGFEQALALSNVGAMLRDGGVFLSNTPVPPVPSMALSEQYATVSYSERRRDHLFWYRRMP